MRADVGRGLRPIYGANHINRNFRFSPLDCASYASHALDTTNLLGELKGINQEETAERYALHRTYYRGIERGTRNVSLVDIDKMAKGLKKSLPELSGGRSRPLARSASPGTSPDALRPCGLYSSSEVSGKGESLHHLYRHHRRG
jgi:transcriptional regulator with XRE-family HTH domain